MCSFLVYNWIVNNLEYLNYFLKFRGPDLTNSITYEGFLFLHNLLHLTGDLTKQPFINKEKKIVCLFNGEIYNYKSFGDYKSDGNCLIHCYLKFGIDFIKKLDGEFAICLFDFNKNIFIISTDVFATKPLWYAIDNGKLGISTYESGLKRCNLNNRIKLNPNTTKIFNISTLKLINTQRVFVFDFNQYKTSYDDWCKAFTNSVKKRTNNNNYPVFVCLSSGYDSGCICAALNSINKSYYTYTILGGENKETIIKRKNINYQESNSLSEMIDLSLVEFNEIKKYIKDCAEEFKYLKQKKTMIFVTDDQASVGLSKICKLASKKKQRILLSGSGADEIYSDYGMYGRALSRSSCFGGKWPDNLNDILSNDPEDDVIWKSFYHFTQRDYLAKEEIISGLYGIEGRYPFLDKQVVQEFLWLTKDLKNNIYKSPLDYFMTKKNYPFDKEVKLGFEPKKGF